MKNFDWVPAVTLAPWKNKSHDFHQATSAVKKISDYIVSEFEFFNQVFSKLVLKNLESVFRHSLKMNPE